MSVLPQDEGAWPGVPRVPKDASEGAWSRIPDDVFDPLQDEIDRQRMLQWEKEHPGEPSFFTGGNVLRQPPLTFRERIWRRLFGPLGVPWGRPTPFWHRFISGRVVLSARPKRPLHKRLLSALGLIK